ncbi:hypothetical protein A3A93_02195 [Candidatus Roizmanbacteria bacterium RIFCSPLOWO2_01_FULL_38_12]|uniref:Glycosyltransferase 2-like domain-containing protein n=1 Tax=Candidatus Roizmanbacteria bacterium RIFCSPLOWO2_01_FULL_38_12 TaxID=1802061 RepID=A0A1F7IY10_9BACT|nr:MAG: hypothetical protein A3F59_03140 [Candidatus Roizmanbacteria bacterium RIFCSPHIGHO2_12_FULL_38_13]OGK48259.1 MAG: hypothetical protein A3A93_02195 [Candidatus Roizmanbacteria bacterium RIFCSPLOWO2_01_FULL_38_12]
MPKLSIIVLSYNTRDITKSCLQSAFKTLKKTPSLESEIIVVDNASSDGSQDILADFKKTVNTSHINVQIIFNSKNSGFTRGNNQAARLAKGENLLFLNSDVIIDSINWQELLDHLDSDGSIAALTVKVILENKSIDPASHRGFPTIWNSFCYYSKLEALTKSIPAINEIFGGYHLTYHDLTKTHEIDSPSGAFYLVKKKLFEEVSGFDEDFFMYGEDLDLSFRLKEKGYKIVYYPKYSVLHLKYQSGLGTQDKKTHEMTKRYFYDAMKIFYKKHYAPKHAWITNQLIYNLIKLKSQIS